MSVDGKSPPCGGRWHSAQQAVFRVEPTERSSGGRPSALEK